MAGSKPLDCLEAPCHGTGRGRDRAMKSNWPQGGRPSQAAKRKPGLARCGVPCPSSPLYAVRAVPSAPLPPAPLPPAPCHPRAGQGTFRGCNARLARGTSKIFSKCRDSCEGREPGCRVPARSQALALAGPEGPAGSRGDGSVLATDWRLAAQGPQSGYGEAREPGAAFQPLTGPAGSRPRDASA